MKFWFGKKEGAGEADAAKTGAAAAAAPDSASVGSGAAASHKPEAEGQGIDLKETSAAAAPDSGAGKSGGPDRSSSAPAAAEDGAKTVDTPGPPAVESAAAATEAGQAADRVPVLKAVMPSQSGATQIRPVIRLKPKAQGPGFAALAAVAPHVHTAKDSGGGAAAVKAPEHETAGVAAGTPVADEGAGKGAAADGAEKGKATIESDGAPVRAKTDQRVLYYQLMNGLYDAILILDEKGFVVDCNTRFTDILGYSREDSWDMPIGKIIVGMSTQMLGHLKSNLAENHHIILDARCFRKDGSSFTAEVGVSVFSLTRGENMVFMIRNVERRKRAMDELRKSHAALETALSPAFVCDTDGFFVIVNNAFLDSFSIPDAEKAKALRFVDLLPDGARIFLRAACGEKIREKLQIAMPDGAQLSLDVALAPVQNGQVITGVAGSIMQI